MAYPSVVLQFQKHAVQAHGSLCSVCSNDRVYELPIHLHKLKELSLPPLGQL